MSETNCVIFWDNWPLSEVPIGGYVQDLPVDVSENATSFGTYYEHRFGTYAAVIDMTFERAELMLSNGDIIRCWQRVK